MVSKEVMVIVGGIPLDQAIIVNGDSSESKMTKAGPVDKGQDVSLGVGCAAIKDRYGDVMQADTVEIYVIRNEIMTMGDPTTFGLLPCHFGAVIGLVKESSRRPNKVILVSKEALSAREPALCYGVQWDRLKGSNEVGIREI